MGVIGFTRSLALELGEDGITVNAICPGSVSGARLDEVFEERSKERGVTVETVERGVIEEAALNAMVEPAEVADTILFLCSNRADKITGQDINVTAGRVMY